MTGFHRITLSEPCRLFTGWVSVGEVDAASFRSAIFRAQPDTQSSEHGVVATGKQDDLLSGFRVEGHIRFLRNPDAVKQNG